MSKKSVSFTVSVRQQTLEEEKSFCIALDVLLRELVREEIERRQTDGEQPPKQSPDQPTQKLWD